MKEMEEVKSKSFALVIEENEHSCNVSYTLNHFPLDILRREQCTKTVKFWSSGCATQFQNQYAFYMRTKLDYDLKIQWNFFEANHGKGAVVGVGGKFNMLLTVMLCMIGHIVIDAPAQFAESTDGIVQKIHVSLPGNELALEH